MKIQKIAGLCILIPVLLAGCGNASQPTANNAAATTKPAQQQDQSTKPSPEAAANGANRTAMSTEQRQMFSTMQSLIMLDKAEGLAITKDQATVMLPVAEDAVAKGELTDENKTKLLEKLTEAQKKYMDDAAARMSNRGNGGNPGTSGGTEGNGGNGGGKRNAPTGDQTKPDTAAKPDASSTGNAASGTGSEQKPARGQGDGKGPGGTGNGNGGGNRGFGDPGKQLVELLQSKVK
ncbi:hypothetical protein GCM10008018_71190 [Paenibacillus marchantiophytorum]|uniref:DUF2680 domain-containing protein n=1 Tax=Paenibacillus marchantiophytorum TaxID=1619310 RepID=A0ABQ1FJT7_9BACL|nr:hypothetical protein [Paenibacillus marchantiophytorum]GGA16426.1 hypothetical protein GCM10008018_71190 [Paenibacillus marchantiophytorum]